MPGETPTTGLRPKVLGMLLSSRCNIACRHCCNHSHPSADRSSTPQALIQIIDQAQDVDSVTDIGFSGGEPMMFPDLLLAAVGHASARGYRVSVTTNGFWGNSQTAARRLEALREAGLTALWLSASAFHREFVDLGSLAAAVRKGLATGLEVNVNVVASATLNESDVRAALGQDTERVRFVTMPCLPAGRASAAVAPEEYGPMIAEPLGACRRHFAKLAVDLDGSVYPCCSPGGFTEPLRLGDVRRERLTTIIANAADNPLIAILDEVGPAFFLPFLRASDAWSDMPHEFVDQCHLCHAMLSAPRAAAVVAEACDRLTADLALLAACERPAGRLAAAV